jgi:DNA adenine methylase
MIKAPFTYFGGKSAVAATVWKRMGDVSNLVEPFFGSGAFLLSRPNWTPGTKWLETCNDINGYVSNFWRAVAADPDAVARHSAWPVTENDLHARHMWLLQQKERLAPQLEGDPDWCDVKVAGWWVWGMCAWIGQGFCSGKGTWGWTTNVNGHRILDSGVGNGVSRQLIHLGSAGKGVNNLVGKNDLRQWMNLLADRLRYVRVACGDWSRVMGPSVTEKHGVTGIFLDPPYGGDADYSDGLYDHDDTQTASDVRAWCAENGGNPLLRIALCGYDGQGHEELERHGWTTHRWKARGGYGSQGQGRGRQNSVREKVWFSPYCLEPSLSFFDLANGDLDEEEDFLEVAA